MNKEMNKEMSRELNKEMSRNYTFMLPEFQQKSITNDEVNEMIKKINNSGIAKNVTEEEWNMMIDY